MGTPFPARDEIPLLFKRQVTGVRVGGRLQAVRQRPESRPAVFGNGSKKIGAKVHLGRQPAARRMGGDQPRCRVTRVRRAIPKSC